MKRSTSYNGMDCVADMDSPMYMASKTASQSEVPWAEQTKYGKYTVYYGIVIIFLASIKRVWYYYRDYSYRKGKSETIFGSFFDVTIAYFRFLGYKQIPSFVSYFTSLPSSLGSSLMYFISLLYLLCYCLVPHFWYRGCSGFGSPPLAVRAGIMATALTPFIYVMAGKANMITLLTGVGYEKLNTHHQFVGVLALILSVIHTIPFIYQNLQEAGAKGLHKEFLSDFYYKSGIVPLILLGWLCLASKASIRKICYEGFLHMHWACGIAYFGTLIWHINSSLNCQDYMWGALAFWGTQIIYRLLVKTAFKPNKLFLRPRKALLQKFGPNAYQITISDARYISWRPGQHVFLRFVGKRMIDNHPFSLCTADNSDLKEMKFIIVPKKGFTKTLQSELNKKPEIPKKVYVDGPYGGTSRDPLAFDKLLLITSGSGVTCSLPFISFIANEVAKGEKLNIKHKIRTIHFIWIVRYRTDLNWVSDELNRCLEVLKDILIVDVYVARPNECAIEVKEEDKYASELNNGFSETSIEAIIGFHSKINIYEQRPKVQHLILSETLLKRNMIISSGSDSLRRTVSSNISRLQAHVFNNDLMMSDVEEVYLHTETFGW